MRTGLTKFILLKMFKLPHYIAFSCLIIFFLRPNFYQLAHLASRISDAFGLSIIIFSLVLLTFTQQIKLRRSVLFLMLLLLLVGLWSSLNYVATGGTAVFRDAFEFGRVPLFWILPFVLGYLLVNGEEARLYRFLRLIKFIVLIHIGIMILQFFRVWDGLFFYIYSQDGLTHSRASGISLFIQEAGVLVLLGAVCIFIKESYENFTYDDKSRESRSIN